jgi:hypothetical protein
VDPPRLKVVFGFEVVAPQHEGLQDVDTANGEPAECDDHQHDECLAQHRVDIFRQPWDQRQDDQQAGQKEDCASGLPKVLL